MLRIASVTQIAFLLHTRSDFHLKPPFLGSDALAPLLATIFLPVVVILFLHHAVLLRLVSLLRGKTGGEGEERTTQGCSVLISQS